VRVELVAATQIEGRQQVASRYFGNYSATTGWAAGAAIVDGHPALVICQERKEPYFIFLRHRSNHVIAIRDFRHASYDVSASEITDS
jgi:hypothetical protein